MHEKEILLCADDFAQSEMISMAILSLAKQHRINAISCLVNMPFWSEAHADLDAVKTTSLIGLHLNLTFGQPLSALWHKHYGDQFLGLPQLIKLAYGRKLDRAIVTAEIQAQIDMFTQDMYIYPDFIDGHQHIQQLPVIREALLAVYQQHYQRTQGFTTHLADSDEPKPCFLRNTYNGWRDVVSLSSFPKNQALAVLGGITWQRMLAKALIPTNSGFGGLYRFEASAQYRRYFKQFLVKVKSGGLIMCHPGYPSDDQADPIYPFRHHELQYLMSDEFLKDLQDNNVCLIKKQH